VSDRPLVAVLDYGIGNLRSAQKALEREGADARLTADPVLVREADAVVLPGVGHFGRCTEALRETGLGALAIDAVGSGRPFFGICVGMQLLYEASEEAPGVAGLGVLSGTVRRLPEGVKRPQMQWNVVDQVRPSQMLTGLDPPVWMYFVHGFSARPGEGADAECVVGTCEYGGLQVAAVERDNVWATQFHPEKSGGPGLALVRNFVARVHAARSAGMAR
jgi:glutamine amidotransferase